MSKSLAKSSSLDVSRVETQKMVSHCVTESLLISQLNPENFTQPRYFFFPQQFSRTAYANFCCSEASCLLNEGLSIFYAMFSHCSSAFTHHAPVGVA